MPQLARLLLDGFDQPRVGMAERVDRDAGRKIKIPVAIGGDEPRAFAALKGEVDARVSR